MYPFVFRHGHWCTVIVFAVGVCGACSRPETAQARGRDDAAGKQIVTGVLDQFGWETLDLGGALAARAIEPLCILWCIPGFLHNEWTHAFKVLHS